MLCTASLLLRSTLSTCPKGLSTSTHAADQVIGLFFRYAPSYLYGGSEWRLYIPPQRSESNGMVIGPRGIEIVTIHPTKGSLEDPLSCRLSAEKIDEFIKNFEKLNPPLSLSAGVSNYIVTVGGAPWCSLEEQAINQSTWRLF